MTEARNWLCALRISSFSSSLKRAFAYAVGNALQHTSARITNAVAAIFGKIYNCRADYFSLQWSCYELLTVEGSQTSQ